MEGGANIHLLAGALVKRRALYAHRRSRARRLRGTSEEESAWPPFPGRGEPAGCRILQKKREKGSVFLQNPPFPFIINGKGIFPRELTRKEKCA